MVVLSSSLYQATNNQPTTNQPTNGEAIAKSTKVLYYSKPTALHTKTCQRKISSGFIRNFHHGLFEKIRHTMFNSMNLYFLFKNW